MAQKLHSPNCSKYKQKLTCMSLAEIQPISHFQSRPKPTSGQSFK